MRDRDEWMNAWMNGVGTFFALSRFKYVSLIFAAGTPTCLTHCALTRCTHVCVSIPTSAFSCRSEEEQQQQNGLPCARERHAGTIIHYTRLHHNISNMCIKIVAVWINQFEFMASSFTHKRTQIHAFSINYFCSFFFFSFLFHLHTHLHFGGVRALVSPHVIWPLLLLLPLQLNESEWCAALMCLCLYMC